MNNEIKNRKTKKQRSSKEGFLIIFCIVRWAEGTYDPQREDRKPQNLKDKTEKGK